jgi:hypothetical protein
MHLISRTFCSFVSALMSSLPSSGTTIGVAASDQSPIVSICPRILSCRPMALAGGKRKGDRMTPDGFALAATIILLCLMFYFAMASLAFLLVKLEIPSVTQLLRGLFNVHFLIVSIAGVIGTVAFAVAGRLVVAIGIGLIAAFAVWARGWFLRQMDAQLSARDAGDANAVRRLRRLHWGGMLCNAIQLVAMVASLPYVFVTST